MRKIKEAFAKIFLLPDTPQRIAAGLGIGVFLGVLPGTGPLAALAVAFLLRVNRTSALVGSLLVNTWLSVVLFIAAVRVGAFFVGADWQKLLAAATGIFTDVRWPDILRESVVRVIGPVLVGYLLLSFALGLVVYLFSLALLVCLHGRHTTRR